MWFRRLSLMTKLLITVNVISISALVGLGAWVVYKNKQRSISFLESKVKSLSEQAAKNAGSLIWNFETASLQNMSDELSKNESFEFVNIYDKDGKTVVKETAPQSAEHFTFEAPIMYQDKGQVGKLVVGYNHSELQK